MRCAALLLGVLALAGCGKPAPEGPAPEALVTSAAEAAVVASEAVASGDAAEATPQPPSESRDPAKVVVAWAKAMTLKDWGSAYLYWGDFGARSGLSAAQFAAKWGKQ